MIVSFDKIIFVLSVAVLSFGYGFAAHSWGWFPKSHVERAWQQLYFGFIHEGSDAHDATYDRSGVRIPQPEKVQPGLTLISGGWKDSTKWETGLKLINKEGEVLHEWWPERSLDGVSNTTIRGGGSYLFSNGDILINAGGQTSRLDACGNVLWTVEESNHHSIARAEDGYFWIPARSSGKHAASERYPEGFPGFGGKKLRLDRILHITENGKIIDDITVLDILYENDLERYIPKALGGPRPSPQTVKDDVTHVNDVEPLSSSMADEYPLFEAGDLLVSLRELSLVLVFDPESLSVKWYSVDPFIYQHDPDFVGNGWIGVFDNNFDLSGGKMLGGSRVIFLQPHTGITEVRFPTERSERFYTHVRGKWQQLGNGNMLLTESNPARVVEVDSSGRTVWEWIQEPTQDGKVAPVPKATRHDLTQEDIAAWPCSSVDSVSTSNKSQ
jgi:hypothetical protein